jgi:N-dimethylarginine dimethylaminohydrolase
MLKLHITNETSTLKSVVLGTAKQLGGTPATEEAYDPKSLENIQKGTYPDESDLTEEMESLGAVLEKYGVEVFRPEVLNGVHQVYARDIGFVIGEKFVVSNILEERTKEIGGIDKLLDLISKDQIVRLPKYARIEGGDVMPWFDKIFVGYSEDADFSKYKVSRTNKAGVEFLERTFKDYQVIPFELVKSDTLPRENALHLDCCFQPIGTKEAILYRGGFKNQKDVDFLIDTFGLEHIIEIDQDQMYRMASNIFSVSPEIIISEIGFVKINAELRSRGYIVEEIKYSETGKMGGLFRCSTLPLNRSDR